MHIGIDFTHDLNHSGIGTYSRSLTDAMIRIEPENRYTVLTLRKKTAKIIQHFNDKDLPNFSDPFPNPLMFGSTWIPLIMQYHKTLWKNNAQKYDLVHFTHQSYFVPGIPNATLTIHDIIPLYNRSFTNIDTGNKIFQALKIAIRQAPQIFVPTEFVRQELLNYFPESKNKITVTYEGSKPVFRKMPADGSVLQRHGLNPAAPFFLYVGRYEERKNLDRLMQAYSGLSPSAKKEIRLVLVCPAGKKSSEMLQNRIADLKLGRNVLHLKNVSDQELAHFYNAALALVFVSLSEGFGLPLLEAMNCGCPAVISNTSALPEISGGSSILVNPADVESIRSGMIQISEDTQIRRRLSEKGLQQANLFSWENAARLTLAGYRKI